MQYYEIKVRINCKQCGKRRGIQTVACITDNKDVKISVIKGCYKCGHLRKDR